MSTLFVGRLRNKGDKLIAASPQIAQGFQQAADALRTYEADRQAQQKEKFLNAKLAADISGGWAYLSQDAKNELPGILGIDMRRDPITGDVQIDKSFDNLAEEAARRRAMANPDEAATYGLIKEEVMSKAPHPAELELLKYRADSNLAAKRYSADVQSARDVWKHEAGLTRTRLAHSLALQRLGVSEMLKAGRANEMVGVYASPSGSLINDAQKMQYEQAGIDTSQYRQLSAKDADRQIKLLNSQTSQEAQRVRARKLDIDRMTAAANLRRIFAEDPTRMGLLNAREKALKQGDTETADQIQITLSGLAQAAVQEAEVDPENLMDVLYNPKEGIMNFFKPDQLPAFAAQVARSKEQEIDEMTGLSEASGVLPPADPATKSGMLDGHIPFSWTKVGEKGKPTNSDNPVAPKRPAATMVHDNRIQPIPAGGSGMSMPPELPGYESYEEPGPVMPTTSTTIPTWRRIGR